MREVDVISELLGEELRMRLDERAHRGVFGNDHPSPLEIGPQAAEKLAIEMANEELAASLADLGGMRELMLEDGHGAARPVTLADELVPAHGMRALIEGDVDDTVRLIH